MAITASGIISEYGAFYQKGSQAEKNLLKKLYQDAQFDSLFSYLPTEDTIVRNVRVSSTPVLQAFQKAFTPAGGVAFDPEPMILDPIKADDEIYPDEIEQTYVGFLASNNLDRKEWPIARWWVEEVFFKQFIEDINGNGYSAVRVAPTAGTAGTPAQSLNGFKKIIQQKVAAGTTNVFNTGALAAANTDFVTQMETFVGSIPDLVKNKMQIFVAMSQANALKFRRGNRAKYNLNYNQQEDVSAFVDFPQIKVVGVDAMVGSSKIWATDKRNIVLAMKRPTQAVQLESVDRKVKAYTDHWRTYGIVNGRYFYTNDLENT